MIRFLIQRKPVVEASFYSADMNLYPTPGSVVI